MKENGAASLECYSAAVLACKPGFSMHILVFNHVRIIALPPSSGGIPCSWLLIHRLLGVQLFELRNQLV